jgi:hypothetical protein
MTTFDPDDYELRWPPQLFVDEANRLVGGHRSPDEIIVGLAGRAGVNEIKWLLTEVFTSTVPAEAFEQATGSGWDDRPSRHMWLAELVRQAASWPEPGPRRPYWSTRTTGRARPAHMDFQEVVRAFAQLIEDFERDGYLVHAFGQGCVDDHSGPGPSPSDVLSRRLGYSVEWPPGSVALDPDDLFDLIEVFHDLVARPTTRWYHDYSGCGWHYGGFATGPARRLYRWRVNRLLRASTLGLRLAEEGEDLGRLVRVEPSGLEDLPDRALKTATPETVDRVGHAIALFRSRNATVEERRSAVITLAGILEERRNLLKAELLSKDEDALFHIANRFAIRHQKADQQGDYDSTFLDWLFWWYLGTVELTNQLLARQTPR